MHHRTRDARQARKGRPEEMPVLEPTPMSERGPALDCVPVPVPQPELHLRLSLDEGLDLSQNLHLGMILK